MTWLVRQIQSSDDWAIVDEVELVCFVKIAVNFVLRAMRWVQVEVWVIQREGPTSQCITSQRHVPLNLLSFCIKSVPLVHVICIQVMQFGLIVFRQFLNPVIILFFELLLFLDLVDGHLTLSFILLNQSDAQR